AGAGDDEISVNFNANGTQTNLSNVRAQLNLRGQDGSDQYNVGLAGQSQARISVQEDASAGDLGVNSLLIFGTNNDDTLFFRPHAVLAAATVGGVRTIGERLDYAADINGGFTVFGRDGDDTFVMDDNSTITTIYGDAGNDTFQVGQMFQS